MGYRIGTDIGGTCTDSTVMDEEGRVYIGKDLTTYPDFSQGIFDSLSDATEDMDIGLEELLQNTDLFLHATSVGENALFERDGSETGLLTTEGFEETLHATRGGYGRWSGLPFEEVKDIVSADKPEPLIPRQRIEGLSERAYRERVVKELDEEEVLEAVDALVEDGVESIAGCLLWSFTVPEHERRIKELIEERYPEVYVSISSEVSPTLGEYERTSTTVLNAYLGPATEQYLTSLRSTLVEYGFDGLLLLMFAHGGLVSRQDAIERPVGLMESGPVGGLLGSKFVANRRGIDNIISTDMGGTTFKVGVINDNRIEYADEPMVGRHHYQFPKRDIHSIAVAGGSVVSLDEKNNVPTIGPESAGSDPGPVCYDRGGEKPTVTDVDLIQGYFSPEHFLGGEKEMDPDAAYDAFEEQIADPLGKSVTDAAADIYKLINSMIADLLREMTVEKGIDPRTFTLVSIGGAAGMHATSYARELDIPEVLIPYTASVNSALGLLSTDVTHEHIDVRQIEPPFDPDEINGIFADLEETARDKLAREGFDEDEADIERSISMRYQRQVHELLTPVETTGPLNSADVDEVVEQFETLYEQRYGKGSAFKEGGIEMTEFRVRGIGPLETPDLDEKAITDSSAEHARIGTKEMHFEAAGGRIDAGLYDFEALEPGDEIREPGVILTPVTTIVLNPGDVARMDRYQNIEIQIDEDDYER
ncbi:hydantoinase/oxoprolinase family protein [Natrarchaeobius chitinivorans]|uniref:Hydantoinase/oxoprolinase family protein n=1 Tax=Natrarchaeobius chitinivorans TaxID=1679083 RepID=A0A3N6M314_NATCH|nr:hydantoinase/oxoprolinase family protein [Natrarchaeobius chitinivorans]RQG94824.1 hydantoinase/oxoprolinase family protein [Natrarchaeobius chitinivorans]